MSAHGQLKKNSLPGSSASEPPPLERRATPAESPFPAWRRAVRRFRGALARIITGDPQLYPTPRTGGRSGAGRFEVPERILTSGHYSPPNALTAPLGYFAGRPIVGPNGPIHGGILIAPTASYALVIDEKYGYLDCLYRSLTTIGLTLQHSSQRNELKTVSEVFALVRSRLPLNHTGVEALLTEKRYAPDEKVALDVFIAGRVATPLHQVALAGYLVERLMKNGIIGGAFALHIGPREERLTYIASNGHELTFMVVSG